jgi:RNA polymerase sigma factor (sigma-70 family)
LLNDQWPAVAIGDLDSAIDLERMLASLPPEHRAVLVLRDLDGLSEQEVADLLDIPVGTAKSRLSRARRAARQRLGGER